MLGSLVCSDKGAGVGDWVNPPGRSAWFTDSFGSIPPCTLSPKPTIPPWYSFIHLVQLAYHSVDKRLGLQDAPLALLLAPRSKC